MICTRVNIQSKFVKLDHQDGVCCNRKRTEKVDRNLVTLQTKKNLNQVHTLVIVTIDKEAQFVFLLLESSKPLNLKKMSFLKEEEQIDDACYGF